MREEYSYNIILLGGTGAKCGEILIHMCANGYLECETLNILYIDSDKENGNARNLKRIIDLYEKCREKYRISESPMYYFFKPEIYFMEANPVPENVKYFSDLTNSGGNVSEEAKILMEVLYSEKEMEMEIEKGFFAHPNVGAAVFAANMEQILSQFLREIEIDKKDMKQIKIFLLGSIFGGTGAASFPTIAKYLRKKLYGESDNKLISEQLKIGGCMVLPYFLFSREKTDKKSEEGTSVEADKFATKTRSALQYYQYLEEKSNYPLFDGLYILGHDNYDVRGYYATAGNYQRNLPHITELYATMSVAAFFEAPMEQSGHCFAVVPKDKIGWKHIYKKGEGYFAFFVMMRFSFVMKSLIMEELFDYTQGNKLRETAEMIPWYYDFLEGKEKSSDMNSQKLYSKFEAISLYCEEYIRWFAELNIANIKKADTLGEIDYSESSGDLMEYLSMFTKKLLIKQYENIHICNDTENRDNTGFQKMYQENLKYIRKYFEELELVHEYTDAKTERIGMDIIWSRICDAGFNAFVLENDAFKNIQRSNDKSMDAGVRNLINAIYCACLI